MRFLQYNPEFDDNAVVGRIPGAWVGRDAVDGDYQDWLTAPLGSIYVYKPDEVTQPIYYVKNADEGRDDDWGALGGVQVIQQRVTRADFVDGGGTSGTLVLDATIPAGAYVTQTVLRNVTGFTGDTSATFRAGDGSDIDRYNTGTPSIFTTAVAINPGVPSGLNVHVLAANVTITVTSAVDFTNVVAGAFTIAIYYLL